MPQDTTDQFIAAAIGGGRRKRDLIIDDLRGLFAASGVTVEHLARYLEICPHVKGMDPDTESRLLSSVPLRSLVGAATEDAPSQSKPAKTKADTQPPPVVGGVTRPFNSKLKDMILDLIRQNPGITAPEMRPLLEASAGRFTKHKYKNLFASLRRSGKVMFVGKRRGMRYWVHE